MLQCIMFNQGVPSIFKSRPEVETNPCWIDYYKVKLVELKRSIKKLDPDHKLYWRDRTRLTRDLRQVEVRLGLPAESMGKQHDEEMINLYKKGCEI